MTQDEIKNKFLTIFNRNIPLDKIYTSDEIKVAFSKESYSSGTQKEQKLFYIFFKNFNDNDDVENFRKCFNITSAKINSIYRSFETEKKKEFGDFWSLRVTRKKLPLSKIKPRKDYAYIEEFQTYELTPCIAYEMALKNKSVKDLLAKHEQINKMMNESEYTDRRHFSERNFKDAKNHPLQTLLKEYENLSYEEYEAVIMRKTSSYKKAIEKDYKKFIEDYIYQCTELSIIELRSLERKIEDELINYYLVYPTGYQRKFPGAPGICADTVTNSKKKKSHSANTDPDKGPVAQTIVHDEFIQIQGVYTDHKTYFVNNIAPNFQRQVNDQNQMNIAINFSLPLEEIQEYIARIHKGIDFKSPLELLGNELKKADDLTKLNTKNKKGKKIELDATKGETPQYKLANLLYIYDMKEEGFNNTDIIYELELEKNKEKENLTAISENTIKKYYEIAKEYIDNAKYRELIIGKSK